MSSACVCHIPGEFCFYCEVYSPVVAENERLRAESRAHEIRADEWAARALVLHDVAMAVFQRARNDVARREGGQCVGTATFADYTFAKRLVRDLQPTLFPEVNADGSTQESGQ